MLTEEERREKELALTGLTGGFFGEIVLLLAVIPCSVLLYRVIYRFGLHKQPQWISTVLSVILITAPLIMAMSVYTHYTIWFCLGTALVTFVSEKVFPRPPRVKAEDKDVEAMNSRLKPFLSNYRSAMMLATCFAILAVDFNLFFPRRFAKCEEYGISLMDVGVGGFIFSGALVSGNSRAKDVSSSTESKDEPRQGRKKTRSGVAGWFSRVVASLKLAIPLLILGLGRFAMVKSLGYQEHVSEYGMHWNFFMTLAGITLLVAALEMPIYWSTYVGVAVILLYQYVLEAMGVAEWVLTAARETFFSQNREGILSCVGYFALYLFGQRIGSHLLQPRTRKQWWVAVAYCLAGATLLWLSASTLSHLLDMKPSRRMVNMPYVLYTLSCNLYIISAFVIVDLVAGVAPNALIDAVATKRNSQLVIFLISNLLTGATNLFVGTFNRPVEFAAVVMAVYMCLVSIVSLWWHPVLSFIFSFGRSSEAKRQ